MDGVFEVWLGSLTAMVVGYGIASALVACAGSMLGSGTSIASFSLAAFMWLGCSLSREHSDSALVGLGILAGCALWVGLDGLGWTMQLSRTWVKERMYTTTLSYMRVAMYTLLGLACGVKQGTFATNDTWVHAWQLHASGLEYFCVCLLLKGTSRDHIISQLLVPCASFTVAMIVGHAIPWVGSMSDVFLGVAVAGLIRIASFALSSLGSSVRVNYVACTVGAGIVHFWGVIQHGDSRNVQLPLDDKDSGAVLRSLLYSGVAGLATGLGAVLVSWSTDMAIRMNPMLLGLAGGVMLTLSLVDLIWPAVVQLGFKQALPFILIGAILVFLLDWVLSFCDMNSLLNSVAGLVDQVPTTMPMQQQAHRVHHQDHGHQQELLECVVSDSSPQHSQGRCDNTTAVVHTQDGSVFQSTVPPTHASTATKSSAAPLFSSTMTSSPALALASTSTSTKGIGVSMTDPQSLQSVQSLPTRVDQPESYQTQRRRANKFKSALLTALALAAHNAPEGLAVGVTAGASSQRALLMVVAMTIHNIPEGVAVAVACLNVVKDAKFAVIIATATGLVEPLAAVLSTLVLGSDVSEETLTIALLVVAGVMIVVTAKELLPPAFQQNTRMALIGCALGCAIMYIALLVME
eukprot:m.291009 g.291009  ORF g.291009 m.291009 type:complete len:633 (-) comp15822_c1_seq9:309-2207(-)